MRTHIMIGRRVFSHEDEHIGLSARVHGGF